MTAAERVQRLLAMLQWAAQFPEGVEEVELCRRFRLGRNELVKELGLASMIGADSDEYTDMPFEVYLEDGTVFVRLFSFRRPLRLTPAEGLALLAAADVLVDRGDADAQAAPLARALVKLAAVLGIDPSEAVDVEIDTDGGIEGRLLRDAIAADRRVRFSYWTYGRDVVSVRVVDPWVLFTEGDAWYLTGWATEASAPRTFRVDRMADVEVLDHSRGSGPPDDLVATLTPGDAAPEVVLELAPEAAWVAEAHPVRAVEPLADGWLRVRLAVGATAWLERLVLQLGPDARVAELPDVLAGDLDEPSGPALVAAAARRVLSRYEGGS